MSLSNRKRKSPYLNAPEIKHPSALMLIKEVSDSRILFALMEKSPRAAEHRASNLRTRMKFLGNEQNVRLHKPAKSRILFIDSPDNPYDGTAEYEEKHAENIKYFQERLAKYCK